MADDISRFLEEDIGDGDITTEALIGGQRAVGVIRAKSDCVVAGLSEAAEVFSRSGLKVKTVGKDGARVKPGTIVMRVEGAAKPMLTCERLALNFIMIMSGVATATNELVMRASAVNKNVRVAGTRKTTPGFRRYMKKAIMLGGGDPHRFRLDDQILVKDNHLKMVGGVAEAVRRAKRYSFSKKVEVEAETLAQAKEAAESGADVILLDNMTPAKAKAAYKSIKAIHSDITVEVSGGINPKNIASYARYADVISAGYITHSAPAADFSMEISAGKGR